MVTFQFASLPTKNNNVEKFSVVVRRGAVMSFKRPSGVRAAAMDEDGPFVRRQDKGTLGHESEVTANDDENNGKEN